MTMSTLLALFPLGSFLFGALSGIITIYERALEL
jgi:hypothetical protein